VPLWCDMVVVILLFLFISSLLVFLIYEFSGFCAPYLI